MAGGLRRYAKLTDSLLETVLEEELADEAHPNRKLAHAECVNALLLDGDAHRLVSASDDGTVRVTDARTFTALHSQRLRRIVFDVAADRERLYAGCDDGTVRVFDHGRAAAAAAAASGSAGGFTAEQRNSLAIALQEARSRQRN